MKKCWSIGLLFVLMLGACQSAAEDTTPTTPGSEGESIFPRPTTTPTDESGSPPTPTPPDGYPPPSELPGKALPEGYPPPTEAPATDPYPAGEAIWIIRPVGEQCAEADSNTYVDLQEAVAALSAAGVRVEEAEMVELVVCQACGCPTSTHYRAQIALADLERAAALGWARESEG